MIAGMTDIHSFALDTELVADLARRVDVIVLLFDPRFCCRRPVFESIIAAHPNVQHMRIIESTVAHRPQKGIFREPKLRALDDIKPTYVLQPDSDEKFGPGFEEDFEAFRASGLDMMMFDYDMPTIDDTWVVKQPGARHCKVFRWRPGLSFRPRYRGYAKVTGLTTEFQATSRVQHYCCWTPEIQATMAQKPSIRSEEQRARYLLRKPKS